MHCKSVRSFFVISFHLMASNVFMNALAIVFCVLINSYCLKQGLSMVWQILLMQYDMFVGICVAKFGKSKMLKLLFEAAIYVTCFNCMYTWLIYVHTCVPFPKYKMPILLEVILSIFHSKAPLVTCDSHITNSITVHVNSCSIYVHTCTPVPNTM